MSVPETFTAAAGRPPVPRRPGPLGFLTVKGPFDGETARPLVDRAATVSPNCRCVVVDLLETDYIDSEGVRALLHLASELEAAGKELRTVTRPDSAVRRTLTLLQLRERLKDCGSLEEACECWRDTRLARQ